jgi:hypothetical protein
MSSPNFNIENKTSEILTIKNLANVTVAKIVPGRYHRGFDFSLSYNVYAPSVTALPIATYTRDGWGGDPVPPFLVSDGQIHNIQTSVIFCTNNECVRHKGMTATNAKTWAQKNWWVIVLAAIVVGGGIAFAVMKMKKSKSRR